MRRLAVSAVSIALTVFALAALVPVAPAAELPLEQRCIASGLVPPQEYRGYAFNHHPEKDREVRATDNYLAPALVEAEIEAVIAD
ncbi:MAG TPA: hypothetical protein VNR67_02895, partial [Solirubrobacterales bacterium]|nr:hypothetical protein [Solirubrobacterales bacterium]